MVDEKRRSDERAPMPPSEPVKSQTAELREASEQESEETSVSSGATGGEAGEARERANAGTEIGEDRPGSKPIAHRETDEDEG